MPINIRNTETSGGERRKRHKHVNTGRCWWPVRDITVSLHTRTHTADHLDVKHLDGVVQQLHADVRPGRWPCRPCRGALTGLQGADAHGGRGAQACPRGLQDSVCSFQLRHSSAAEKECDAARRLKAFPGREQTPLAAHSPEAPALPRASARGLRRPPPRRSLAPARPLPRGPAPSPAAQPELSPAAASESAPAPPAPYCPRAAPAPRAPSPPPQGPALAPRMRRRLV